MVFYSSLPLHVLETTKSTVPFLVLNCSNVSWGVESCTHQTHCYLNRKKSSHSSSLECSGSSMIEAVDGPISITVQRRGTTKKTRWIALRRELKIRLWTSLSPGLCLRLSRSLKCLSCSLFSENIPLILQGPSHKSPLLTPHNWGHPSPPCTLLPITHFLKIEYRWSFVHLCCWMGRERVLIHLSIPNTCDYAWSLKKLNKCLFNGAQTSRPNLTCSARGRFDMCWTYFCT